jgi:glycyl-tRNA synthetase alpha subunit
VSFRWVNKDPDEVLDYSVDWSRWLNGASITSVTWSVDDANGVKTAISNGQVVNGIQRVSSSINAGVVTIHLGLGTVNKEYKFYCRITDSTGSAAERVIKLNVKEQ